MNFDPTLLRTFVAVKETGGFTRAAQRLHLTQSAVSHQIRRLEEEVGRPLLHRTTRSLSLTEDGEDFLRYAEQILRVLDAVTRRFQPSPLSGVVRFGSPENFMGNRLPSLLAQFARAFPAVRLDVNVGICLDLGAMIDAGDLDLAVVISEPGIRDGGSILLQTQFVWAASETFELPRGAAVPLAFSPAPCVHRQVGVIALEGTQVEWNVIFTSPSQHGLCAAVLAGLAITALPRSDLKPGMKIVDGQYGLPPLPPANYTLIWSAGEKTPAACELGKLVLEMSNPRPMPALSSQTA